VQTLQILVERISKSHPHFGCLIFAVGWMGSFGLFVGEVSFSQRLQRCFGIH